MENIQTKPSKELAYWVGVAQSDGSFFNYNTETIISLHTSKKSLPMLIKFQQLSLNLFNRNGKVKSIKPNDFYFRIRVKKLLNLFERLGIKFKEFEPPFWVIKNPSFFGAYLAGIIDGDGNVYIRHDKNLCSIRIFSNVKPILLHKILKQKFNGYVGIYHKKNRYRNGEWFEIEFYISKKNRDFITQFVLPYITLPFKYEKLETFINNKIYSK